MSRIAQIAAFLALTATACTTPAPVDPAADRSAVEAALSKWPLVLERYDWDGIASLIDSSTTWIEEGPAVPVVNVLDIFRTLDSAQVAIDYGELRDLQVGVQGDMAWGYWLLDGTFTTDTDAGRAWFRAYTGTTDPEQREWRFRWVESAVLRRTNGEWRFVFGHTSRLPEPVPGTE
jgi:hypothetical protein